MDSDSTLDTMGAFVAISVCFSLGHCLLSLSKPLFLNGPLLVALVCLSNRVPLMVLVCLYLSNRVPLMALVCLYLSNRVPLMALVCLYLSNRVPLMALV